VTTPTPSTEHRPVLVVDYGAQYAQLIARRVREADVYSEIVPSSLSTEQILAKNPVAIILSGGPSSVYAEGAPRVEADLFEAGVPVLGICYGFQAMAAALGGTVAKTGLREYGSTDVTSEGKSRSILSGTPDSQNAWMSHGDSVQEAPEGFDVLARTAGAPVAAFANEEKNLYGVQWHPEVKHSRHGQQVLENFLFQGAGLRPNWSTGDILESRWSASAPRSATPGSSAASPAAWTPPSPPRWSSAPWGTSSPASSSTTGCCARARPSRSSATSWPPPA
jgi:GMP synthase (glutamine-hydrolysing)